MAERTPGEISAERAMEGGPQLTAREVREAAERHGSRHKLDAERDVTAPPVTDDRAQGTPTGVPGNAAGSAGYEHAEAALGGADNVQKTTWGVGTGTEPRGTQEYAPIERKKGEGPVVARTGVGGGMNPVAWIVGLLALVAFLMYAFGIFGRGG